MVDFVFEEEAVEVAEQDGGSFGTFETGVYAVTINFASLDKTEKGNNTLSLDITTEDGHSTTIWSAFGTIDKVWASGAENFGYNIFQSFMGACGAKSITPTPFALKKEDGTPVQKDGKDVVLSVVKELHGVKCKLAIQKELDIYNGDVKERNLIHSAYNAKGQTYLEAKAGDKAEKIDKVASRLTDKQSKRYKQAQVSPVDTEEESSGESLL